MPRIWLMSILLAIFLISCTNPVSTEQSASSQLIFSLRGSGDPEEGVTAKSTDNFHISKTEWFIETTCEALDPSNQVELLVTVYPKGSYADFEYIGVANQNNPGSAKNYFSGTGDFYLVIITTNVKTWTINVYQ
jgi:hypothetical protein